VCPYTAMLFGIAPFNDVLSYVIYEERRQIRSPRTLCLSNLYHLISYLLAGITHRHASERIFDQMRYTAYGVQACPDRRLCILARHGA
jgi:hypothetical protein